MRARIHRALGGVGALLVGGILVSGTFAPSLRGDEPGSRLGRLFRFGGAASSQPRPEPASDPVIERNERRVLESPPATAIAPLGSNPVGPGSVTGPINAGPRIRPQARATRAFTESDPIVTRATIGRADGGATFGLFMQVFADGTVVDNEGVHNLGRDAIRGVLEAMESGDLFRSRGYCGGPPTDFVEQIHVVVYERSLGRLRANAFSYSGNTQGCDHSVRQLHSALDALQAKLSRTPTMDPGPANVPTSAPPVIGPAITTGSAPAGNAPAPFSAPPIRLNEGGPIP